MKKLTEDKRAEIIQYINEHKLTHYQIAAKVGVSPGTVSAIKAHMTMGTYSASPEAEEIIEATETTFGLEKDLQKALRANIEQLEEGLKIIDGGKERVTESGRIDITAEDQKGETIVIELKAGTAGIESIGQILSYIGDLQGKQRGSVRGILVAGDFHQNVVNAARAVPRLQLRKYTFKFTFSQVK